MLILLATDGSPAAISAAQALALLPLPPETRLILVTVLPVGSSQDGSLQLGPTREVLDGRQAVACEVRYGVPAEEILRAEEAHSPDLLVLGTRGFSAVGRFWIGSVSERVAQYARVPVLLVWPAHTELRRVVVGLVRSPVGERTAAWLREFPLAPQAELHLATFVTLFDVLSRWSRSWLPAVPAFLRVIERRECQDARRHLESVAALLSAAGHPVRVHVRTGEAASGLTQLAEKLSADLLVVGSHGRGLLGTLLLGSVSDQVLVETACSLLIVKPPRD